MIPLMVAALGGGLATASVLAPFGTLSAVIAAPFGGSVCAVLAAYHLTRQRGSQWQAPTDLDEQADSMVAALRDLTAQAKRTSDANAGLGRETDTVRAA